VAPSQGNRRGLDIGCQSAVLTDVMESQTQFSWIGVDPTITEPSRSATGLEPLPGVGDRLPFAAESFEVALFAKAYEHVGSCRVLAPGGFLIGQIPNPYFPVESDSRLPFLGWRPMWAQQAYWRLSPCRGSTTSSSSPWVN